MSVALTLSYDMRDKDLDYNLARLLYQQLRQVAPNYLGDFYPLTPYNLSNSVWMAWQYDRPESGEGMVQAFRRPDCHFEAAQFKLHGLDKNAKYLVTDLDHTDQSKTMTGEELMKSGVSIEIPNQPGAALITYKLKKK
jgi:alpha-galactosidase